MSKEKQFIPKKKKATTIQMATGEKVDVAVIPKDLQDKMGAVQACATAFTCIDKACLPHNYAEAVKASLQFLMKLHEQTVEEALKHPQAHMVPELKQIQDEAKKDGKSKN